MAEKLSALLGKRLRSYVTLTAAATRFYEASRGGAFARIVKSLEKQPKEILDWYRYWLAGRAELWGVCASSRILEKLPDDRKAMALVLSVGGADTGYMRSKSNRIYTGLCLTAAELRRQRRHLEQVSAEWAMQDS